MSRVMVRYKVKPACVSQNESLVRAVYDELHRTKPVGIRYATFQLDDGVTFVHLASLETDDGRNPLSALSAFQEFQSDLHSPLHRTPDRY
jgi:hypothetical protein